MTPSPAPRTLTFSDARVTLIQDGELDVSGKHMFKDLPRAIWAGALPDAGDGGAMHDA